MPSSLSGQLAVQTLRLTRRVFLCSLRRYHKLLVADAFEVMMAMVMLSNSHHMCLALEGNSCDFRRKSLCN